jgi:monothiol glutaredoxin
MDEALRARIEQEIKSGPVVLFMKGTPAQPRCGFSATVAGILNELVGDYRTFDVLSDAAIREGIKEYSDWPTIPQLYIHQKFVGGCDVVKEMFENGELEEALGVPSSAVAPNITVTDAAQKALLDALGAPGAEEPEFVRVHIDDGYQHSLSIGPAQPNDVAVNISEKLQLRLDRGSARRAQGLALDCVAGPDGPTFKINNPNEPPRVQTVDVKMLAALMKAEPDLQLFDVRTKEERDQAHIVGSRLLDRETRDYVLTLDKSTPLYFHCHHGHRSLEAAGYFLQTGFTKVYNVEGGIEAWSVKVDPTVPRYQRSGAGVRLV